ncbi:TetR/AcrR family transcriptional regulator [Pseudonocardia sp. TRM90224]|uniref:TetR/AcrR family transcriptional regulator n=1 Tax=Pseudonocardia sp. TRM90224 TaxID=2812678 RepID=UPI001E4A4BD2|nr:TetR/AcrR family transcriptional regulator [Pseudonocardia sp. TRM90224]
MLSQRRNVGELRAANAIPEETILDAAYTLLLSIGMRRMTMADIARQAGVSRATLYRRWGGVREVIGTLITREWAALGATAFPPADVGSARARLVSGAVTMVRALRNHAILRTIVELDPEFLLPYLLHRRGTSTTQQLGVLEAAITAGATDGSIRAGDVGLQARTVLLIATSFVLSAPVLLDPPSTTGPAIDELDQELRSALDRYLAP